MQRVCGGHSVVWGGPVGPLTLCTDQQHSTTLAGTGGVYRGERGWGERQGGAETGMREEWEGVCLVCLTVEMCLFVEMEVGMCKCAYC